MLILWRSQQLAMALHRSLISPSEPPKKPDPPDSPPRTELISVTYPRLFLPQETQSTSPSRCVGCSASSLSPSSLRRSLSGGYLQLLGPYLASGLIMIITVKGNEDPIEHHTNITVLIVMNPSNKSEVYWWAWPRSVKATPVSSSPIEKVFPSPIYSVLASVVSFTGYGSSDIRTNITRIGELSLSDVTGYVLQRKLRRWSELSAVNTMVVKTVTFFLGEVGLAQHADFMGLLWALIYYEKKAHHTLVHYALTYSLMEKLIPHASSCSGFLVGLSWSSPAQTSSITGMIVFSSFFMRVVVSFSFSENGLSSELCAGET